MTAAILLLGSAIRLLPLTYVDFRLPFRMGGLYVEFAQQIAAHHFFLPARIPFYTEGGIPFAYPPLPFYVQAALLQVFSSSTYAIANLLPPLTAIVALLCFFLLVRALKLQPLTGTIALAAFATLPSAYYEQWESAGLAEAFGSLALVLFGTALAKVYHSEKPVYYGLTGLALGISVLASPGSAAAAALMFVLFTAIKLFTTKEHRFAAVVRFTVAGVIGVLVASPYLVSVIQYHGAGLFWNILRTESSSPMNNHPFPGWLSPIFNFNASGALYPFIWDFIAFSGLIWAVFRRQWWLPLWYLAMFMVPREGWWTASIPASLLVGFGVTEIWFPFTLAAGKGLSLIERAIIYPALAILFCAYALINVKAIISQDIVKGYDREHWVDTIEAAEWVKTSTPADSRFIVMIEREAMEWTPYLMQRTVLNTPYGAEWEPDELRKISALGDDLGDCSNLPCIRQAVTKFTSQPNWYGFLRKRGMGGLSNPERVQEAGFELIWENREVVIVRFTGIAHP
ncbi:MAG: hypothetical protein A2W36_06575 [Chloroflexi bacterium RBG_16_58_14]|nr:MAG: hypothetical protein A2W36_06575 [Chloroflexi bacterium RBG_16_58_14]